MGKACAFPILFVIWQSVTPKVLMALPKEVNQNQGAICILT